jgi:hypothetical protein
MVMASREKMCKTLSDKNPSENSFNFITEKVYQKDQLAAGMRGRAVLSCTMLEKYPVQTCLRWKHGNPNLRHQI